MFDCTSHKWPYLLVTPDSNLVRLSVTAKVSKSTQEEERQAFTAMLTQTVWLVVTKQVVFIWTFPLSSDLPGEGERDEELSAEGVGAPWLMRGG